MKPTRIVIIGRPNVGKSTLFNRLIKKRKALVHDMPGVTRDRNEELTEWWVKGKKLPVLLIDTGGVGGDKFAEEIEIQVGTALETAELAIFLLDGQAGVVPGDRTLMKRLKQAGIDKKMPVIGVVNKVDAEKHEEFIHDFYTLGLETLITISAEHGRGIDDLQIEIASALKIFEKAQNEAAQDEAQDEGEDEDGESSEDLELAEDSEDLVDEDAADSEDSEDAPEKEKWEEEIPRVAIVGRPNVGKSTLTNALLGEDRMITSPIAGTTVDAVDSVVELGGKPFIIIDTAGIRRKSKTEQGVEVLSVVQARKALERANVALLLLDGETGITDQDEKIGGLIEDSGCGVILVMSKWDTQSKNHEFTKEIAAERIRKTMAFLRYAPIMFVSAKKRQGLQDLGDLIQDILHQRKLKIPTHEFTEWVREEATIHNPANAKFFLCHQTSRHPPTFVCHVNDPDKIHFSLRRHLVNAMRERWGFMGSPVKMLFKEAENRRSLPKPVAAKNSPRKPGPR